VSITDAIPGWTAYYGNNLQTAVLYDSLAIGSVNLAILDANVSFAGFLIPGNENTVVLQAGGGGKRQLKFSSDDD
jgi:hypothetical protein